MANNLSKLKYSFLFSASLVFVLAAALVFPALFFVANATLGQSFVPEGTWRGTLHYPNGKNVSFNFEVKGKTAASGKICLLTGEQRFEAGKLRQKGDSLYVPLNRLDNELVLKIGDKQVSGFLRSPDDEIIPVDAVFGQTANLVR